MEKIEEEIMFLFFGTNILALVIIPARSVQAGLPVLFRRGCVTPRYIRIPNTFIELLLKRLG
jgi:hypothetical protein